MTDTEKEALQAAMTEIAAQIKAGIPNSTVEPVTTIVYKKYAKIEADADGYLVKTAGYLVKEGDTPPDGTIELTDEQEEKLNNGSYVVDLTTMELAVKPAHVNTPAENKAIKLTTAGAAFATKRDAIRWITVSAGNYGFDCASEDITNFLAASKAAELAGSTQHKVWLTATTKGLISLTAADCTAVFTAVRDSQFSDYSWYEDIKARINACTTQAELDAIVID